MILLVYRQNLDLFMATYGSSFQAFVSKSLSISLESVGIEELSRKQRKNVYRYDGTMEINNIAERKEKRE